MICNIDKFYPYRFPKKRLWILEDIEIINYLRFVFRFVSNFYPRAQTVLILWIF